MEKILMKLSNKKSYIILSAFLLVVIATILFQLPSRMKSKIGIVDISGTLMDSNEIIDHLTDFNVRSDIKGIILRLDTPGGGVAVSQEIYEKVKEISIQNDKPIYASMASTAASGGYYIALGADTIIANKGSITGSIGVIMGYPTVPNLLEKIGVEYNTVKSGKYKDSGSLFRLQNKDDWEYFQGVIGDMHNQFIEVLSYERNLTIEDAKVLADGRVFTGVQAKKNGLIDIIGTLDYCVKLMSQELGLGYKLDIVYPDKGEKGVFGLLSMLNTFFEFGNLDMFPLPQFKLYYNIR